VLTLKRCREILGPNCEISDEELRTLRDQLYVFAEVALHTFVASDPDDADAAAAAEEDEAKQC
jgi:hypothetical protein